MTAPLAGVRVLDLSRILAGPFAAQLFADLGAEVVKVEPPAGDPTRRWGPPFDADGESAYFRCANRGKTSRFVDAATDEGKEAVEAELRRADVVVENFLPASARRLGLTPSELRARHPRLVVASVRAFASDVEAAGRPGYDFLVQAESGWMSITGEPDGRPMKIGVALVDVLAALYLANGVTAALLRRERTGEGAHVEVPLMEAAIAGLVNVGAGVLTTGETPRRYGNAHPNIVPYQSFACRDGDVAIAVGNDRQFAALVEALRRDADPPVPPEWGTNPGRVAAREEVVAWISGRLEPRSVADALAVVSAAGVACGPIRSVDEVLLRQRGRLHDVVVESPDEGGAASGPSVATPILIDGERAFHRRPPPRLPPKKE